MSWKILHVAAVGLNEGTVRLQGLLPGPLCTHNDQLITINITRGTLSAAIVGAKTNHWAACSKLLLEMIDPEFCCRADTPCITSLW